MHFTADFGKDKSFFERFDDIADRKGDKWCDGCRILDGPGIRNNDFVARYEVFRPFRKVPSPVGSVTRPVKELRGYRKVFLAKGETKTVEFTITPETIAMYNLDMKYIPEPGDFKVWIAANAADEENEGLFSYREKE